MGNDYMVLKNLLADLMQMVKLRKITPNEEVPPYSSCKWTICVTDDNSDAVSLNTK
jgi:hypothetical protein